MARRRRYLLLAFVVLALSVAGGHTYGAWSSTTSATASTFSSYTDLTPPSLTASTVAKTQTGYYGGYVKAGAQYNVYASATDGGSPATGMAADPNGVTANLTSLTAGQSAAALTSGSYPLGGVTYGYKAGPFTAAGTLTNGSTQNYTFTLKDAGVPKSATTANQSVIVDSSAPVPNDVQAVNKGTTAGKAESGDTLTFSFNDVIDPASIISTWTGASTNVTVRLINGGGAANDSLQILNGASQITQLGTVTLPNRNYASATVDFTSSPMVEAIQGSGATATSTITITLGSTTGSGSLGTGTAAAMTWAPLTGASAFYDRAGNTNATASVTETGTSDAEF